MTTPDPLSDVARAALRVGLDAQQAMLGLALGRLQASLDELPAGTGHRWRGPTAALLNADLLAARADVAHVRDTATAAAVSAGVTRRWLDE